MFCNIWHFFKILAVSPAEFPEQGISWIELLCMFFLYGGKLYDVQPDCNPATTKPLLSAQLALFKRTCKHVASTCLPTGDRLLFSPSTRPDIRLKGMGYGNFFSCIQMHTHNVPDMDARLLVGLFTLRSKPTQRKTNLLLAGDLRVPVTRVRLKGVAPWEQLLTRSDIPDCIAASAESYHATPTHSLASEPARVLHLECPKCNAIKSIDSTPLYANGHFRFVFCRGCKHSTCSKQWQCLCGHAWFRCPIHSATGFSFVRAPKSAVVRDASSAGLARPEAGVGVFSQTKRRRMPDDSDKISTFASRRPTRKRARSPTALESLERIRSARANPLGPSFT